jgi:hypothetical protein
MSDPINPSHYTFGAIECIEALEASMSSEAFKGFLKGNCIKYLWRFEQKKGSEDLKKAKWYLERLIALRENDEQLTAKIAQQSKDVSEYISHHDPDDYMISGCPDGFCPMPTIRQGPSEIFPAIN